MGPWGWGFPYFLYYSTRQPLFLVKLVTKNATAASSKETLIQYLRDKSFDFTYEELVNRVIIVVCMFSRETKKLMMILQKPNIQGNVIVGAV